MNLEDVLAGDLMTPSVLSVAPHEPLRAAAKKLSEHRIHCLVVLPARPGRAVGVLTTKDIIQVLCDGEPGMIDQLEVADVMTTPAVTVQRNFPVLDCIRLMRHAGVRSAPVLDGTELVGLLSFTDVLRRVADPPSP